MMENDYTSEWDDEIAEESIDPFEGISQRDQDLFFRVLDLMPNQEEAMDYFMSHADKIRVVIASVKNKKEIVMNHDIVGLQELLAQERIILEHIDASQAANAV